MLNQLNQPGTPVIYNFNRIKRKKLFQYMQKKSFYTIQHSFMIKKNLFGKLGIGRNFLSLVKSVSEKPTNDSIFNG